MIRSFTSLNRFAALLIVALLPLPQAMAGASSVFYVPINRAELVNTNADMGEVIITDPEVADVYAHGRRSVSIMGKAVGQTTLRIFDNDHKLIRSMDVYVTYDLPAVRKALREFLPAERIGVSMVNTRIALTGDISSAEAAATAMEIAEEFVRGKISPDAAGTRKKFIEGNRVVAGEVSPVINLMKIASGQQVMLRIRIGEIQRSALKNLGVNLTAVNNGNEFGFLLGTGTGQFGDRSGDNPAFSFNDFFGVTGGESFGSVGMSYQNGSYGVGGMMDALERDGMLKLLAEPNLTALSGEEAQFLAGGEFPIAVPQQLGTTTIEYKPFGVALKFTPFVLSPNRIRIRVQPEVSELSNENAIETDDGFTARSIITRRASTTVELAPGESFMIAGLISDTMASAISEMPGVGEIPVLSALFRSTSYQRNETELVIAVTPYLVDPLKHGDVKLPTDDFRPASFMESIFYGALGAHDDDGHHRPSMEGPTGFMTD